MRAVNYTQSPVSLVACLALLSMSDYAYSAVYMNHKWTEEEEGNRKCTVGRVAFSLSSLLSPQSDPDFTY